MPATLRSMSERDGDPSLRTQAYRHIQSQLLNGTLKAGQVISELTLARELGISRTPVREAIGQLQSEGLVEQVPRRGTVVRSVSRRDLVELYELREALESYAASRAAQRIGDEDLQRLQRCCQQMDRIADDLRASGRGQLDEAGMRSYLALDMGFHMLLIRASGNGRIMKQVADSRLLARLLAQPRQTNDLATLVDANGHHRGILAAVERHDPEAARQAMGGHIIAALRSVLDFLDRQQADGGGPALALPGDLLEELARLEGGAP